MLATLALGRKMKKICTSPGCHLGWTILRREQQEWLENKHCEDQTTKETRFHG
jgi:hypothetical protein